MKKFWWVGVAAVFLVGCRGEEIGRIPLKAGSDSGELTWTVSGVKKAKVWANYNGRWQGKEPGAKYELELKQGEKSVGKTTCTTAGGGSRVCANETRINNDARGDCEGSTDCTLEAPADGTYTVTAKVLSVGSFSEIKDMSIIIRK